MIGNLEINNIDELVMLDASISALMESLKMSKLGIIGVINDNTGEVDEETKRVMTRELDNAEKSIAVQEVIQGRVAVLLENYQTKVSG